MRPIEFRGLVRWNGNHLFSGDWIEGFYVYKSSMDRHFIYTERDYPYNRFLEVEILEGSQSQFAGFRDKRNQKLFEGHIVYDSEHCSYMIVYFSVKGTWRVKSIKGKVDMTLNSRLNAIEIVGDIHLNPDKFLV